MNTKQIIKKTALAGAMFLGVSGVAQAGALAISIVEMDNLLFSQNGTTLNDPTNFNVLNFTSDGNTDASLNGANASSTQFSSNAAPINLYDCLGDCSNYNDNDFTGSILSGAFGYPGSSFSISDQQEVGSPINGVGGFDDDDGAFLANASQSGVVGDSFADSESNNGLQAFWSFTGISGVIDITFDLKLYLESYVELGDIFPTKATASYTIIFDICDNQTMGCQSVWSEVIAANNSATAPGANGNPRVIGSSWGAPAISSETLHTASLLADREYQLTATILTKADVTSSVPEPATLALLGLSLLGFGAARKRRTA